MLMHLFFTRLFVSGRKQIALMSDEKLHSQLSHRLFATSCSGMRIIMKIKLKTLKSIYLVLYLFILIFAPPFFYKTNLILAAWSVFLILKEYQKTYRQVLGTSGQKRWMVMIAVLLAYAMIIIVLNGILFHDLVQVRHYASLFNRYMVLTITLLSCSTYCICYFRKNGFGIEDFIRFIIYAGLIESGLVFLSFISSGFHNYLLVLLKKFGDSTLYGNAWYIEIRSYGFAGTLLDTFGLGMGLLAGISLFYGVLHEKRFLFYSVLIAIAGTIDSRTTALIYLISVFVIFIYSVCFLKIKLLVWCGILVIGVSGAAGIIMGFLENVNNATYVWIMGAFESIKQLFFSGKSTGTFEILFSSSFWKLPNYFQFVFGTGHSLYQAEGYLHSDVGYINDLWFVGIIGIVFVYGNFFMLIRESYVSYSDILVKMSCIFIGSSFLVFNIKGCAIGYNPGMAVMLSLLFLTAFLSRDKRLVRRS